MYLTKIDLERASRRIQFALADCQQLHRLGRLFRRCFRVFDDGPCTPVYLLP